METTDTTAEKIVHRFDARGQDRVNLERLAFRCLKTGFRPCFSRPYHSHILHDNSVGWVYVIQPHKVTFAGFDVLAVDGDGQNCTFFDATGALDTDKNDFTMQQLKRLRHGNSGLKDYGIHFSNIYGNYSNYVRDIVQECSVSHYAPANANAKANKDKTEVYGEQRKWTFSYSLRRIVEFSWTYVLPTRAVPLTLRLKMTLLYVKSVLQKRARHLKAIDVFNAVSHMPLDVAHIIACFVL